MKPITFLGLSCCLAFGLCSVPVLAQVDHTASINQLKAYHFGGDQAVLDTMAQWVNEARRNPETQHQAARELAQVLQTDASFDAKQWVCRQLILVAGEEQVPALVSLLHDEALAHYALMVLEHIPGKTVDEALQRELTATQGRPQLEIINTLGERRQVAAIDALTPLLNSTDAAVAEAASAALAKMGDARAQQSLQQAYAGATGDRRLLYARALLRGADRLRISGDAPSALAAYRFLERNPSSPELNAAALRGIVQVNGQEALPLLLNALDLDGSPVQAMAVSLVREIPGREVTQKLAEQLSKLSTTGQLLLMAALRDRGDGVAAPAVMGLFRSPDANVRMAAVDTLGAIGDAATVPLLVQIAAAGKTEQRDAARTSLSRLRGQAVDNKLLAMLGQAPPAARVEIINSLGQRHVITAVPRLVQEAHSAQPAVSTASWRVLRDMGRPSDLPALLQIVATKPADERSGILDAVAEIAHRGVDENQRTGAILTQLARATNPALKADLLTVLGQVGGSRALTTLRKSLSDPAPEVRLAALRRVAEWPTDEPLQDLLKIVHNTQDEKQRAIALRGYIRMIGLGEQRSPDETVTLFQQVSSLTKSPESKRLVLAGLARIKSLAALDYASTFLSDKSVQAEAESTLVEIGQSTVGAWRDKTRAALQPIAQGATDEEVRKRASEVLAVSNKFGDFITAWQVSPAYQSAGADWQKLFDMPFAPEQPEHQKEVSWRLMPVGTSVEQPWLLDLLALWGGEQKVAYLRTEVWSDTVRDAVLELGSDDGVKVWCNGQVVFADNTQRAVVPGQDKVTVRLKPGSNQLMLKITQNVLGWGACARFTNPDGSPINGLRYAVPLDKRDNAAHSGAV